MEFIHTSTSAIRQAADVASRLSTAAARKRPLLLCPAWQTLPVAGIDVPAAQSVLYRLRKLLAEEDATVIQTWLHALQLAQVASDRLLQALAITQRHLNFWKARLQAGSHSSFLLLSRGPGVFVADVLERLGIWQQQQTGISASDRIEERIIALQLLSMELAQALAAVHRAADAIRLSSIAKQQQQHVTQQHVLAAVAGCVQTQAAALQQLLDATGQLQEQDVAVRQLGAATMQAPTSQHKQATLQPAVTPQQVQQELHTLQQLLHVEGQELSSIGSADAGAALRAASQLAAALGPLVTVPPWAAMPSALQRHWIRYMLAAGVGVYACTFLYRNSRLAGSPNLDTWLADGVAAVEGAWANHVVAPLITVRDELFRTFRDRPSIVSAAEFEADKASLLRMLTDFQRDHAPTTAAPLAATSSNSSNAASALSSPPIDIDAINQGMQVVMQAYESDLQRPIRGLVSGELARTLLIQVQRLKCDTEAAMLELDQILRANELSISLVAAVPALLVSWTLLRGLGLMLLVRPPPDAHREATPCRLAMAELERALAALQALKGDTAGSSKDPAAPRAAVAAAEGMVLYKLFKVYREAQALYRLKDNSSKYSDWPHMSADLLSMVQLTESPAAKLELHRRMLRTYYVLQP